ncbi:vacuolar fusion protein MON1 [Cladochytrium replicatum]|nr:vacuolar fusion protein MON1 [Cladochytrium replicatum]
MAVHCVADLDGSGCVSKGPTSKWATHKKHFFIFSSAGKPIYSRHGDESKLASYMGVLQAIMSFFVAEDDSLRSVTAGRTKFVFLIAGPLYFVAVASTGESDHQLRGQLHYLQNQVSFVLTQLQINRILEQRLNYDLRNLLQGTDVFMHSLAKSFYINAGQFLTSLKCLRLPGALRARIGTILSSNVPKQLLFGILLVDDRLVNLVRPKRHALHPSDLHLLINMVSSTSAFETTESWIPICLPHFNSRAFLHCYVSYLTAELCLILMSTEKDAFFEMSAFRSRIASEMEGIMPPLELAVKMDPYSLVEVGIPGIRHFLYKSRPMVQYTLPASTPPYTEKHDLRRLMRLYQYAYELIHRRSRPARVVWAAGQHEAILCWTTKQAIIFAAFSPLISKTAALESVQGLQKWVRRNEEDLFVTRSPTF